MRLKAILRVMMLIISLTVLMFSIMELVFSPILLINYYLPSIMRAIGANGTNFTMVFFYSLLLTIEFLNFLASLMLGINIFITGYFDKYFSYARLTLISSALSLAIIVHDIAMNMDFYGECVERDIYIQASRIGTVRCRRNRRCIETDVARWHQTFQCCGWDSPNNLVHLYDSNQTNYLPVFCCPYDRSLYLNLFGGSPASWSQNEFFCKLNSLDHFNKTCNNYRDKFFLMKSITIFGHPMLLWYSLLKISFAYFYAWAQRRSLLPQSEGAFAMRIPP